MPEAHDVIVGKLAEKLGKYQTKSTKATEFNDLQDNALDGTPDTETNQKLVLTECDEGEDDDAANVSVKAKTV